MPSPRSSFHIIRAAFAALALALAACGTSPGGGGGGAAVADGGAATGADGGAPDAGLAPAPLAEYSIAGIDCPTLVAGSNDFESRDQIRKLLVYLPATPLGAGLLFLWHGLGDSPANFARGFGAQSIADRHNLVVVVPAPIANVIPTAPPTWTFAGDASTDLTLFDDVRACASRKLGIDLRRVYSLGFSAGALWTTYLLVHRSDSLAAVTIFSGGASSDGQISPRYQTPAYATPSLLTEGGTNDVFASFVHFDQLTAYLYEQLQDDDVLTVKCGHTGGHRVPTGGATWGTLWLTSHTFGAASPYTGANERPADYPAICTFPAVPR